MPTDRNVALMITRRPIGLVGPIIPQLVCGRGHPMRSRKEVLIRVHSTHVERICKKCLSERRRGLKRLPAISLRYLRGKNIGQVCIALAFASLVSGCAGVGGAYLISHTIRWTKAGATQQQINADWYQCQRENQADAVSSTTVFQERMAKQCMAARGYGFTESGI